MSNPYAKYTLKENPYSKYSPHNAVRRSLDYDAFINSTPELSPEDRELFQSEATKLKAARHLSILTRTPEGAIANDYEAFSKAHKYSGNHLADWQHMQGHEEQRKKVQAAKAELAEAGIRVFAGGGIESSGDFKKEVEPNRIEMLHNAVSSFMEKEQLKEVLAKSKSVKGFWESLKSGGVPGLSIPKELNELGEIFMLKERFEANPDELHHKELIQLAEFVSDAQRPRDVGGMIGEILTNLPEIVVAFLASGPAAASSKQAVQKLLGELASESFKKSVEKHLFTRAGVHIGGKALEAAARLPIASIPYSGQDYLERISADVALTEDDKEDVVLIVTGEGKSNAKAFKETVLNSYIEVFSEMSGGIVQAGGREVAQRLTKYAFFRSLQKLNPKKGVREIRDLIQKTGYNMPIGEMFEERVGEGLRALTGLEDWQWPSAQQLTAELIAFSIPGAAVKIAERIPSVQDWALIRSQESDEDILSNREGSLAVEAANGNADAQQRLMNYHMGLEGISEQVTPDLQPADNLQITHPKPKVNPAVTQPKPKPPPIPETAPGVAQPETPLPVKVSSMNKAEAERVLTEMGADVESKGERQKLTQLVHQAKEEKLDQTAEATAASVVANPRQITAKEYVAMHIRYTSLKNDLALVNNIASEQYDRGNIKEAQEYAKTAEAIEERMAVLLRATLYSGSEQGRALSARQLKLNMETFEVANLVTLGTRAKNAPLTVEERKKFNDQAKEIEKLSKLVEKLRNEQEESQALSEKADAELAIKEIASTARRRKISGIKAHRKALKARIAQLGYRINDITNSVGLSVEAAGLISKLAITHIQEGATTLKEVVRRVQADVDVSERDVWNSLGGRVRKEAKRLEGEVVDLVSELKTQARLQGQIKDALENLFPEHTKRKKPSKEVKRLQELFNELIRSAYASERQDERLEKIEANISAIQDMLNMGIRKKKKDKPPVRLDIKAAQEKYNELVGLLNTLDAITDLQQQLEAIRDPHSEYIPKIAPAEKKIIRSAQLEEALFQKAQLEKQVLMEIRNMRSFGDTAAEKAWNYSKEGLMMSRAALATLDFSYAMRQGLILSGGRPLEAVRIFKDAGIGAFNPRYAARIDNAIKEHKDRLMWDRAGLFLSEMGKLSAAEELFLNRGFDQIPLLKHLFFIKGFERAREISERNMVLGLNMLRVSAWEGFMRSNPGATLAEQKAVAHFINLASGRGDLKKFGAVAEQLSTVFFAPRYAISRFQAPWQLVKPSQEPAVRRFIAKQFLGVFMFGASMLTLAKLAGFDVSFDPEDSDFLKIVYGDTRYDIFGGLLQPMRLLAQGIYVGLDTAGFREMEKKTDLFDAGRRFINYKAAPFVNLPVTLLSGRDIMGRELSAYEALIRAYTPLMVQETYDVWENTESPEKTLPAGVAIFGGIGVQEHDD